MEYRHCNNGFDCTLWVPTPFEPRLLLESRFRQDGCRAAVARRFSSVQWEEPKSRPLCQRCRRPAAKDAIIKTVAGRMALLSYKQKTVLPRNGKVRRDAFDIHNANNNYRGCQCRTVLRGVPSRTKLILSSINSVLSVLSIT